MIFFLYFMEKYYFIMSENLNLSQLSEKLEKFDIDVNENEPEIMLNEVYRKDDLILYEYEDEDIGPSVSEEIIRELFPEFDIDPRKYYLLEKNGEIFY